MLFISKGIPEKNGISAELRIVIGGQVCTVFGLEEDLWLRGRLGFAETASRDEEAAIQNLLRNGLAEYTFRKDPATRYTILSRCMIIPSEPGKRNALAKEEKILLNWIRDAGFRLSLAELVYLFENRVRPTARLLGEDNRQALTERLYPDGGIEANILEAKMASSKARDTVVDAVIGLLQKKRVVLL